MSDANGKARVNLKKNADALVIRGGVRVEFSANGGGIVVYTDGNVRVCPTTPEIGDKMPDGTIYAGISPDTGEAMYVTPADAPGTLKWKQAMKYAADLDANGHKDWKLPTKAELNVIFENCAAIGGFDEGGTGSAGWRCWYWSSTEKSHNRQPDNAWLRRSHDGLQGMFYKSIDTSVRPVRTEPRPSI